MKLLTLGNSFADNALEYLGDMARLTGRDITVFRANLGGHSLAQHADYMATHERDPEHPVGIPYEGVGPDDAKPRMFSLRQALRLHPWDYVTIQQVSHDSFRPETYEPHAEILINFIRRHAPQAEIIAHQTWAYREDHELLEQEGLSQEQMHHRLVKAYAEFATRYGLRVIPSGAAFHAARALPRWKFWPDLDFDYANPAPGSLPNERGGLNSGWRWQEDDPSQPVFGNDAKHANTAGRYLAGVVWHEFLFGEPAPTSFVPEELTQEEAAELRAVAHQCLSAAA